MKRRRSRIDIRRIMDEVAYREEIGMDMFPVFPSSEDYVNLCLITCGGMSVHDVFVDARIGNKLR